jgi:hypothetical protein
MNNYTQRLLQTCCLPAIAALGTYSASAQAALTFTTGPVIQLSPNARPTDVAVADFNSDGRPDLAIVENGLDSLAIFRQQPGGTFSARPDSHFLYRDAISVVALPLIYGPAGSAPPPADALAVYTGAYMYFLDNFHNAQGTLTPRPFPYVYVNSYTFPLRKARLFAAKMDSDQFVDLVTFLDTSPNILGGMTLSGSAAAPSTVQANMTRLPNSIPALSLVAFHRPGYLDGIVPNPVLDRVYVVSNLSSSTSTGQWWTNVGIGDYPSGGSGPVSATAADVDGDGQTDLAAAHETSRNVVITLLDQLTSLQITLPLPSVVPQQVELTDLNGDSRPDVVVLATNGTLWLYRNTGLPGTAAIDPQPTNLLAGATPSFLRIADVNNDGKPDLVVPARGNGTVSIFYNQSTPLAVSAAQQLAVQVYPNPAAAELHIQHKGVSISSIVLLDAVGRPLRTWGAAETTLPVADVPRGVYILRIITPGGLINKRIVLR